MLRHCTIRIVSALAALTLVNADSPQTVNLGFATYEGTLSSTTNITSFFGVRYAAPPHGSLRFQAPRPPPVLKGVQLANEEPAICFRTPNEGNLSRNPFAGLRKRALPPDSEDCLFLNVFVPGPVNSKAKLPVVVCITVEGMWYIGGEGAGSDGGDLIREAGGGIVAVTIEYRLGVFGFLAGSTVKRRGALNAGLLDQRAALEWVQQRIHSFGGDPTKVTIWGESAGAGSVMQHMIADGGNTQPPLFRAGMLSSLFLPPQFKFDDPIPERIFSEIVQQTGCASARDQFACLVATDAGKLEAVNINVNANGFFGTFVTIPVIDGSFIRDRPTKIIQSGKLNGKLLFAMNNQFEGRIFVNQNFTTNITTLQYARTLFPGLSSAQARAIVSLYQGIGFDTVFDQAVQIMGDSIFVCPTFTMLHHFQGPSFKGEFAIPPGDHGSDVVYYFPGTGGPPFKNPQFDASFSESFLAVVKSFDPNGTPPDPNNITPRWQTFAHGNFEMLFNRTDAGQPIVRPFATDPRLLGRCLVCESLAPFTTQ